MSLPAGPRIDKNGDPFIIRPYAPRDRGPLGRMYDAFEPKRGAQGLPPAAASQRVRWLDRVLGAGHHLVVEVDRQLLGHGMVLPFDAESAELANFLHQSIRDRGIGTALNQALLGLAAERGLRRVWLCVEPSNRRAIRSYEKAGFRRRFTYGWAPELEMEIEM